MAHETAQGRARRVAGMLGALLVALGLGLIWVARLSVERYVYVSELGADGEPTAPWFRVALLLVVAGGCAVAWAGRGIRSRAWFLWRWTPALSLTTAAALFLVASQVPCTSGCPLPVGDSFRLQDFVHTLSAVLAFTAACVAMLQTSFSSGRTLLSRLSMISGCSVAIIAGTGGILSLVGVATDMGGILELIATSIAIGWLIVFGLLIGAMPVDQTADTVRSYPGTMHQPRN